MFLLFDLSERDFIHIALFNEATIVHTQISGRNRELLTVLEQFLDEQKFGKEGIKGIMTVVGAGGFTNTRVGTVAANTFAFVRHVPLLAITKEQVDHVQLLIPELLKQPVGQYISASYSAAPNITESKKSL